MSSSRFNPGLRRGRGLGGRGLGHFGRNFGYVRNDRPAEEELRNESRLIRNVPDKKNKQTARPQTVSKPPAPYLSDNTDGNASVVKKEGTRGSVLYPESSVDGIRANTPDPTADVRRHFPFLTSTAEASSGRLSLKVEGFGKVNYIICRVFPFLLSVLLAC